MNPYEVLGIDADAEPEVIRSAYLALVRRYPPDRAPAMFRRIRAAYEHLEDPVKRAELRLFGTPGIKSLGGLSRALGEERRRVGLAPWLKALSG